MTGFTAEWLALREPADARARAAALVHTLRAWLEPGAPILDLATGTGANIRYLAPLLGTAHPWTAIDHDTALLDTLAAQGPAGVALDLRHADLRDVAALPVPRRGLVTASALLDLVSERWLEGMVARCASAGAAVLFALSYDGRIAHDPPHPEDARVRNLVNAHQRGDKGFGAALGPEAAATAARLLAAQGYRCASAASDWILDKADASLQRALVADWADAAIESAPGSAAAITAWRDARMGDLSDTRSEAATPSRLLVGHVDLAAWPHPRSRRDRKAEITCR